MKIIRTILKILAKISSTIDKIYPKQKNLIIFGSNTGQYPSGNPQAIYKYIQENNTPWEGIYYLPLQEKTIISKIIYILKKSHKFYKAQYLISSHPTNDFIPLHWSKKKKLINVWHGTPLKSLFYTDHGETPENLKIIDQLTQETDIFTVSSPLEAQLIKKCFHMPQDKIHCTGHPRNDYKKPSQALKELPSYKKLILYCPTYRRGKPTQFFPFPDMDFQNLNQYLEKENILLLIRGHINHTQDETSIYSTRIIDYGFNKCPDINSILPEIDILITDYSSIYIDYLTLNKPCLFIPYDLDTYKKERGLLLEDYDYWAPGPKIKTYKQFINNIKELINNNDEYTKQREEVSNKFHQCQTGNSTIKILKLMEKEL